MSRPRRIAPRQLRPARNALDSLTLSLAGDSTLAQIQLAWELIAGEQMASQVTPSKEHDGVLVLSASAAVWAQEATLLAPDIIANANKALGREAIKEVRCKVGRP
jgi:hypothetical protein